MKFTFLGFSEGDISFAANVLGARGALLSVLAHFFEQGRWGSPVETGLEGQTLTARGSALHPHRVGIISNGHERIGRFGYANLLRARGVLVSFA